MQAIFSREDKNKPYNKLTSNQKKFLESFANCDEEAWEDFCKNENNRNQEKYNFLMSFNDFLEQVNQLEKTPLIDIINQLKISYSNRNYDKLPYYIKYILDKHNITNNKKLQDAKATEDHLLGLLSHRTGGKKKKKVVKKRKPTGKKKVRKIYKGPRGGRYYISKGKKVYL